MPSHIYPYGDMFVIVDESGAQRLAYPASGGAFIVQGEPPPPEPPPPPPPPPPSSKRFIWPFDPRRHWEGGDVGPPAEADYGPRSGRVHQGMDFGYGKARNGAPVIAAGAGRLEYRNNSGFGFHAVIDHGDGIFTVYGHMQNGSGTVNSGSQVQQGQRIGSVGNTGASFGAHLHWETHVGGLRWTNPGTHRNPRDFMQQYG